MKMLAIAATALVIGLAIPASAETALAQTSLPVHQIGAGNWAHDRSGVEEYFKEARWGHRISKRRVIRKLKRRGFWGFEDIRHRRHAYVVFAHGPRGHRVRVRVDAYSGDIIRVKTLRRWRGHRDHGGHWGRHGGGRWN